MGNVVRLWRPGDFPPTGPFDGQIEGSSFGISGDSAIPSGVGESGDLYPNEPEGMDEIVIQIAESDQSGSYADGQAYQVSNGTWSAVASRDLLLGWGIKTRSDFTRFADIYVSGVNA